MDDSEESDEDFETKEPAPGAEVAEPAPGAEAAGPVPAKEALPGKSTFDTKTTIILWSSAVMFAASAILCTLYFVYLNKIVQTIQSMETIRSFLTTENLTNDQMNDTAVLGKAFELVKELELILKEMEAIEENMEMIKEKIESGWKGFQGHLYYISESTMIYPEAILECKDLDSVLAPIPDLETEYFAEFMTKFSRIGVWIGLQKKDKNWIWVYDNSTLTTSFWKRGEPKSMNTCVEIEKGCANKGKCWSSISCDKTKHAFCRLEANPRWIS